MPKWVTPTNYITHKSALTNAKDGYGYLLVDYQHNVETKTLYTHIAIKVINFQGIQNASQISIGYSPLYQKIVFHDISINRNGKIISCLNLSKIKSIQREEDLERHMYNSSETAFLALENVQKGDVIEYSYSKVGDNPLFKNNYADVFDLEYSVPIGCLAIKINANKNRKLNFKYYTNTINPTITSVGEEVSYTWLFNNLQAKVFEDDLPSWYKTYNGIEVTDFTNWKSVREWAENIYKEATNEPFKDKEVLNKINSNAKNTSEKILQAVHIVQDEVRYFGFESGINGIKPHSPNAVYNQRFGDCKDKSVLLCAILKAIGVEAYVTLIHSNAGFDLPNRLPSPYQFNHAIVAYKLEGALSFIDPTMNLQGGDLNDLYVPNYHYGLVLNGKGEALTAMRYRNTGKKSIEYHYYVQDFLKPTILKVKTIYTGSDADEMRYTMSVNNYEETKQSYIDFYARLYPEIEVKDSIRFKEININEIEVTESYTVPNLWKKTEADSNTVTAEFMPFLVADALSLPATKTRKKPMYLKYPVNVTENVYIHVPKKWEIEITDDEIKTDYLDYSAKYRSVDGGKTIAIYYSLTTLVDSISVAQTNDALKNI
ncbi:MAG: DUF3857 and transglutaminase domain-containing protein, partial [Bacteroidia bacterium]